MKSGLFNGSDSGLITAHASHPQLFFDVEPKSESGGVHKDMPFTKEEAV